MRAARLLQMLLILQNRGRQTAGQLARELEVTPRTILRDVDAMTEAGLPIIVFQGNRGGIELGFNYRTRLTGLSREEAEALGLVLGAENPMVAALGMRDAAMRARTKLVESLPDRTREQVAGMRERFALDITPEQDDPRIGAIAKAVMAQTEVRLRFASPHERLIHPARMRLSQDGWEVFDQMAADWIAFDDWGRVNISAKQFTSQGAQG